MDAAAYNTDYPNYICMHVQWLLQTCSAPYVCRGVLTTMLLLWSLVQFRLVVKYRHCDEELIVKATDDKMVGCHVRNSLGLAQRHPQY